MTINTQFFKKGDVSEPVVVAARELSMSLQQVAGTINVVVNGPQQVSKSVEAQTQTSTSTINLSQS